MRSGHEGKEIADESRRTELMSATTTYDLKQIGRNAAEKAERELIRQVLLVTNWNRRRTAYLLQVSHRTLLNKIQKYDLDPVSPIYQELNWRYSWTKKGSTTSSSN
jgi:DNA-binding NtrC family response regulator